MDKITKFLGRLSEKERETVTRVMAAILHGEFDGLARKKLRGHANVYRVRVMDMRIVYLELNGARRILLVDRRDDNTYRDF